MHHHADPRPFEQRRLRANGILRLQLESPPVGPDRRARPRLAQQAGNLVRLGRMMDGADAKAELPGDGQNRRDVARAIAMDVDADIAGENSRQRLQLQRSDEHTSELQSLMSNS